MKSPAARAAWATWGCMRGPTSSRNTTDSWEGGRQGGRGGEGSAAARRVAGSCGQATWACTCCGVARANCLRVPRDPPACWTCRQGPKLAQPSPEPAFRLSVSRGSPIHSPGAPGAPGRRRSLVLPSRQGGMLPGNPQCDQNCTACSPAAMEREMKAGRKCLRSVLRFWERLHPMPHAAKPLR